MFLKRLIISSGTKSLRDIRFHKGINLIVDETPTSEGQKTGNNVGKTTVLKLVDFCLGANPAIIFSDTENRKEVYALVKEYLVDNNILITLILSEDLDRPNAEEIVIERNFLSRKHLIRRINGKPFTEKEFEAELLKLIIPNHKADKPTFRQIISHNIRYRDESINSTLKTLDKFTTDVEYEALYLFLLGCTFDEAAEKQAILTRIKQESLYKERLEKKETKTGYEIALSMLEEEIKELNYKKSNFNINENFEEDLNSLNAVKYDLNRASSGLTNLKIRRDLIVETEKEMSGSISKIDLKQLEMIYKQAVQNVQGIQRAFEDLVTYHNDMIIEKVKFITADLPILEKEIGISEALIKELLRKEKELSNKIAKSDSFEELEQLIVTLNEKYRAKGEYESAISQFEEIERNLDKYEKDLESMDTKLFSGDFEEKLKSQLTKFNKCFSAVSNELYGERYALKYDKSTNKNNQTLYKFSAFNANLSSGKKQGEILCFDLAYSFFADEESIPCLHFLLNDKKELMHDNQLVKVADYIKDKNIQLVVSILKDKLPDVLNDKKNIILELSQESKLFRIEEISKIEPSNLQR